MQTDLHFNCEKQASMDNIFLPEKTSKDKSPPIVLLLAA